MLRVRLVEALVTGYLGISSSVGHSEHFSCWHESVRHFGVFAITYGPALQRWHCQRTGVSSMLEDSRGRRRAAETNNR